MNPIHKRFDANQSFPFGLVYQDTKSLQRELPDHLHDWHELVYVYKGKGTFFIDRTFYDMMQGDLFVIPANTIHRAFPDRIAPVTSTAVFFSPKLIHQASFGESFHYLHIVEHSKKRKVYKYEQTLLQQQATEAALGRIYEELEGTKPGRRHAIVLQLQHMLLGLGRDIGPGQPQPADHANVGPGWMKDILLYIDEHLNEDVGLRSLAGRAAVTASHFSRVFKQLTGLNVTEYVMTKRMIMAKDLLLDTDDTVGGIADRCGFESLTHFHRTFKRIVGMTPAAYRKSAW